MPAPRRAMPAIFVILLSGTAVVVMVVMVAYGGLW